jgi:ABC-type uncharacterized transport system involved in gliding motility auxiliary subunit
LAQAKQLLGRDNLTVAAWDSLGKGNVPADANVIVVAGPRTPFLPPETEALRQYLSRGGRVLVLADPVLPAPGAPSPDLGLAELLTAYGLRLDNDIVIDPARAVPLVGPETVIADRYGSHEIVRSLAGEGLPVLFPLARSVSKVEKVPEGMSPSVLVETTAEGWGETALDRLGSVQKDAQDKAGPVAIGYAVSATAEKKPSAATWRLVVFGNSRFVMNGFLSNGANANLFLNSIHWLAGQERLVGIAPKAPEQSSLTLTQSQVNRLGLFAMLGLPALAVALGVWVWYRRRD